MAMPGYGQADTLLAHLQNNIRAKSKPAVNPANEPLDPVWPKAELQYAFYDWFFDHRYEHGNDSMPVWLLNAEQAFLKQKETELARLAWSLRVLYKTNYSSFTSAVELFTWIQQSAEDAQRLGWHSEYYVAQFVAGYKRFEANEFGAGLELMLQAYDKMESEGWPGPVIGMILHQRLGHSFYKFGDYENCIRYLRAGLRFPVPRDAVGYDYQSFNTIGLCFSRLEQYDSAVHYFTLSRDYAAMHRDSFWMCLMDGNMGHMLFNRGEMQRAKDYLMRDYHGSIHARFL